MRIGVMVFFFESKFEIDISAIKENIKTTLLA